jgi:predicted secreted hydrolase
MRSELALLLAAVVAAPVQPGRPAPAPATSFTPSTSSASGWLAADPAWSWSFPRDHHAHPRHRNEWWYFTGTLAAAGDPGRRFGYQLTFFRIGIAPDPPALDSALATGQAVMVHAAVTDVASGRHLFSEVLWRAAPLYGGFGADGDPLLAWARAPAGTDGTWTLRLEGHGGFRLVVRDAARGLALDLAVRPEKPIALQGPNGFSRKAEAEGYASLYYSMTRLATDGTLTAGGEPVGVRGTSWMDRELGSSQLAPSQVGWDWWSLRLDDGRDLMLYVLRRADGSADFRRATLVEAGGRVRVLAPGEWSVLARGSWTSRRTGARYPQGWSVTIPGERIALLVDPLVSDAENVSSLAAGLSYWEGPVRLTGPDGRPAGEGYAELTGYGERSRPPI